MSDPPPPKRWHTREDSGLRLDAEGGWWHDDERVEHPKIVEAFDRGLQPAEDGKFKLVFGSDWCLVQVDGPAYRVLAVHEAERRASLVLALSDRTQEALAPETLSVDAAGVLHCRVKEGRALARFTRDAQFQLGSMMEEVGGQLALRLGERTWHLPLPA